METCRKPCCFDNREKAYAEAALSGVLLPWQKSFKRISRRSIPIRSLRKEEGRAGEKTNLQITEEGVLAVDNFNLHIQDKEFIVLVGPSGCGKSTTLRMVAGLEEISGGELYIGGQLMNDVAPKDRDISMVFQNYALYPP